VQDIKEALIKWNSSTSERQKLQHAYLAITIVIILIAGIVSLVNSNVGHKLTLIALVTIVIFIINGIVWSLLTSIIGSRLPKKGRKG